MYVWSQMSVMDAIEFVLKRNPGEYNWGYYPVDRADQTGARGFQWFESPGELLDFIIGKESIASNLTGDGIDEDGKRRLTSQLKQAIGSETALTPQLLKKINSTETWIEILWWGTFADLIAGKDEFSANVGKRFQERAASDRTQVSIPPEYLPQFLSFISDFHYS